MNRIQQLRERRDAILRIADRHGARNLRLFGSAARGEEGPESDLDFLVDFAPDRSLVDHVALKQELEDLLGREVDVVSERALHPLMKDEICREAVVL